MHFSIPETEVRSGENRSTYVVSSRNVVVLCVCVSVCHVSYAKAMTLQVDQRRCLATSEYDMG